MCTFLLSGETSSSAERGGVSNILQMLVNSIDRDSDDSDSDAGEDSWS